MRVESRETAGDGGEGETMRKDGEGEEEEENRSEGANRGEGGNHTQKCPSVGVATDHMTIA